MKLNDTQIAKEMMDVEKSAPAMIEQVKKITIKTKDEYLVASEVASVIDRQIKTTNKNRTELLKPFKDHISDIEARFRDALSPLKLALETITVKQRDYLKIEEQKRQEAERKAQEAYDKKMAKAEKNGKTAIMQAPVIEKKAPTITTGVGKTTARKSWSHKVTDVHKLPLKYRKEVLQLALEKGVVDQVMRAHVRNGVREIAGVEIFEDFTIARSS